MVSMALPSNEELPGNQRAFLGLCHQGQPGLSNPKTKNSTLPSLAKLMTEEPDALNVHVRICGGVVQQWAALPGNGSVGYLVTL